MWNVEALCGYKPITTFWDDFSIAEIFGPMEVIDTYHRAFREWKGRYEYLTELVMVLNHKIWQHYEMDRDLAAIYNTLWHEADNYACEHLQGDELAYFFEVTD